MKTQYLLTIKSNGDTVRLSYAETGHLQEASVHLKGELSRTLSRRLWEWLPTHIDELRELQQNPKYGEAYTITEIQSDLSFGAFWTAYGNKVGKKARAERLWEAMSDIEKAAALGVVQKYKKYLAAKPHIEQAYPETWLAGRRWENEYKGT